MSRRGYWSPTRCRRAPRCVHAPARTQPPACHNLAAAEPPAARGAVLLYQAALRRGERARRPAMVMPIGVLAAFPGQKPHVAAVRPVQRQVPADIRIMHDQVRPQVPACDEHASDGLQPGRDNRPPPGTRPCSVQAIACCRPGLTPHPRLSPAPVSPMAPRRPSRQALRRQQTARLLRSGPHDTPEYAAGALPRARLFIGGRPAHWRLAASACFDASKNVAAGEAARLLSSAARDRAAQPANERSRECAVIRPARQLTVLCSGRARK